MTVSKKKKKKKHLILKALGSFSGAQVNQGEDKQFQPNKAGDRRRKPAERVGPARTAISLERLGGSEPVRQVSPTRCIKEKVGCATQWFSGGSRPCFSCCCWPASFWEDMSSSQRLSSKDPNVKETRRSPARPSSSQVSRCARYRHTFGKTIPED